MAEIQESRRRGRPATGHTPKHYFRAPQALWDEVVEAAAAAQPKPETATAFVIRAIKRELQQARRAGRLPKERAQS